MKVNEIFYSLQGEGYHTGEAATFVRFAVCNLNCPFCDTLFNTYTDMTEEEIVSEVKKNKGWLVVITGGEPSLQLTETLVDKLHHIGKYVAVETNGTKPLPHNVDWVTLSPKEPYVGNRGKVVLTNVNEIKIVYDGKIQTLNSLLDIANNIESEFYYIQPCDTGSDKTNKEIINYCINFVKNNPKWKLSLQTQKILNVQ